MKFELSSRLREPRISEQEGLLVESKVMSRNFLSLGGGRSGAAAALARYDAAASRAAHEVIKHYSTSFSWATSLLQGRVREDIRNLYAVVRIADEMVDGVVAQTGATKDDIRDRLDSYEAAVLAAPRQRFHQDLVLHAYARSARRCGFQENHVRAFFASMRRDIAHKECDADGFDDYVYGSAEVIGLLCLAAFLAEETIEDHEHERLEHGARSLGAAFQKINFLRDLGEDHHVLERRYFPQLRGAELTESSKAEIIADIRVDLSAAREVIPRLPRRVRPAVVAATDIFTNLTDRLESTPAPEILANRLSVPARTKATIITKAILATGQPRRRGGHNG